jgi:hypothetical protein
MRILARLIRKLGFNLLVNKGQSVREEVQRIDRDGQMNWNRIQFAYFLSENGLRYFE